MMMNSQKEQENLFIDNNQNLKELGYYEKNITQMVIANIDSFPFFEVLKTIIKISEN